MKMIVASVFAVGLLAAAVPASAANAGVGFVGVNTAAHVQHDSNVQDARWHRHRERYCRRWGWHHRCHGWGWRW
jgi:hypothetical protein